MSYPHYPSTQLPASSYQSDHTLDMSIQHRRQISQPLILPINSAVIAHYHDVVWCAGVIQTYNVHPNGMVEYRVVFHSGDIRTVTAGKVLHKKSVRGQIMIGSRVVVEHPIRPVYMTGLIAEIPNDNNMIRYLIFLDDGSAIYKSIDKLWVVGLMDNPIDCLPSNYKMFIQKYFVDINNIKLFRYSFGETVRVSFINNGMMQSTGKVMQVDCNIMLVKYSSSNDVEWLYLGSNRVLQDFKEPDIITVQDSPQKAFPVRGNSLPAYNRQLSNPTVSNNYNMLLPVTDTQPNQSKFTSPKRYIKSPLKSKGLMLSPQLDPFMFSDEDPSSVNRMSFDNYVPPVTVQDPTEPELIFEPVTPTPVSDPNRQLLGSPILILDSPDKQPRTDQLHIPHNQHHSLNNQLFTPNNQLHTSNTQHLRQSNSHLNEHLTSNNSHLTQSQHLTSSNQNRTPNTRHLLPNPIPQTNPTFISPHKSGNGYHHPQIPQMFQQPTHQDDSVPNITIDSKAPSSFFNWSSSAVTEQPSISKDISPKVNIEFDIEDTLLTQDSLFSQDSILSQIPVTRNLFCSTPPPSLEPAIVTPPRTIEQIEIIDDEIDSKADVKPVNGSFPIILHQEACEADESDALPTTAVQNGNVIELVVESDVGNTIISVATPQVPASTQVPVVPSVPLPLRNVKLERSSRSSSKSPAPEPIDTIEPKVTRSSSGSTKPGKRRRMTPTKTPKLVPKITIELDSMNKAQPAIIKKECTVQKAEKKTKRQQTKDIRDRQIKSVAEIKREEAERNNSSVDSVLIKPKSAPKIKLKDIEYPSFVMKKEPIKLNSEAKISRWSNPWAKRVVGASRKDQSQVQASAMLSGILSKLEDTDQDSDDLEEGEIDSDSEDSIVTKSDNDHTCSRLCIKAMAAIPSTISPLSYPFQRGWRRVISPDEEYLHYVTPCGKVKKDLPAVLEFFNSIKIFPLSIANFCFNPAIKLLNGSGELDESSEFYCPDISNGLEFVTVPPNSDVSLQKSDHFKYIIDRLFEIKPVISHLETSCNCVDNCQSEYCNCTSSTTEGVRAECNNLCGCNMNCRNRVAQRGLRQLLQVRKEKDVCRVFALHDIPQGSLVCTIMGKVKKCPPELNRYVFPLDLKLYKEEEDSPVIESKESNEPRLYHHSDNTVLSNLQTKSEISCYSRLSDSPNQPYNAIWAGVLSKHARLKTTNISEVSAAFPSILPRGQTKAVKSKPCPSAGKVQTLTEYCIDCSQFGNVSRFLRSDAEYNLVIRPVLVDNQDIPWLALFSIKDIMSGSELVYKDFPH